ncbi:ABC transporter ATP-binding protein [Undibacter mobilis]|uniref:ABC transporter ATP-binding protein n=1 Tax=Undibacter mobilis TaxID=2292256 RepID=A0A371B9R5_9BRAD|nr:ABC transporter ATP-binding protein [Undibacter mobilis]RDV04282.1 ABC transporter ATP-binding protein [Undibacter mobilis]
MNPILKVRDAQVSYGRIAAVQSANLDVWPGTMATIIGANGAGKTTLLNATVGLIPALGYFEFDGYPLDVLDVEDRAELGLCIVPERRELFGSMSVEDNLLLGYYVHRRERSGLRGRLADVFDYFPKLAERRHQQAVTLSGGERQMLALGRALMGRPKLLLLDEPSLGLAPLIVQEIFRIIQNLKAAGVSILLVEQNARAALECADYGYLMETGEITLHSAAADLLNDPRVTQAYLGGA